MVQNLSEVAAEAVREGKRLRAGADDRHIALEGVPELRQLIKFRRRQEPPDTRQARILL